MKENYSTREVLPRGALSIYGPQVYGCTKHKRFALIGMVCLPNAGVDVILTKEQAVHLRDVLSELLVADALGERR